MNTAAGLVLHVALVPVFVLFTTVHDSLSIYVLIFLNARAIYDSVESDSGALWFTRSVCIEGTDCYAC
jgi:hypothetical protein